jgi:CsoR family transcriptional regulator, copper-sensing transcriptional repressor
MPTRPTSQSTTQPSARATAPSGVVPQPGRRPAPDAHFRHAYTRDKAALLRRISRLEGQVRGIARMVEREEYCMDILQQTAALRAAVDSLNLNLLEEHIAGCLTTAVERGQAEEYTEEVMDVLRRTMGRPVRTRPPGD